jgi:hypothetical protein
LIPSHEQAPAAMICDVRLNFFFEMTAGACLNELDAEADDGFLLPVVDGTFAVAGVLAHA